MSKEKNNNEIHTSPLGEIYWAHIHKPNQFGKYCLDLMLDPAQNKEHEDFVARLQERYESILKAAQKAKTNHAEDRGYRKFKPEVLQGSATETGKFIIKFDQVAVVTSRTTGEIIEFEVPAYEAIGDDGDMLRIPPEVLIGNKSLGKVSFYFRDSFSAMAGYSMQLTLKRLRVDKLVGYEPGGAGTSNELGRVIESPKAEEEGTVTEGDF